MKNYEKANDSAFGEPTNECFINDMEEWLKTNLLILQIFKGRAILQMFDDVLICRSHDSLISLHKWAYDAAMWANFYCTIDKPIINGGEIKYEWEIDTTDPHRIIWFDHDLGDLAIDTCNDEQLADWGLDDSDKVGSDVYFYYIT